MVHTYMLQLVKKEKQSNKNWVYEYFKENVLPYEMVYKLKKCEGKIKIVQLNFE